MAAGDDGRRGREGGKERQNDFLKGLLYWTTMESVYTYRYRGNTVIVMYLILILHLIS